MSPVLRKPIESYLFWLGFQSLDVNFSLELSELLIVLLSFSLSINCHDPMREGCFQLHLLRNTYLLMLNTTYATAHRMFRY